MWVGAAVLAAGALVALALKFDKQDQTSESAENIPAGISAPTAA